MSFVRVTYRRRNDPEIAASPKPTSSWVARHKTWKLEHTAYPAGWSISFRMSLPRDSVGQNLFQVVGLVLESSLLLGLSESLVFVAFIAYSARA